MIEQLPQSPNQSGQDIATAQAVVPSVVGDRIDIGTTHLSSDFVAAHVQSPLVPPTGGDFQVAFPLKEEPDKIAFVLGDVSGHGHQASIHAAHLKAAIVGCLDEGLSPSDALGYVNAAAEMDPNFPGFATVIAGTVETATGQIVYSSGGHEPALIASPPEANQGGSETIQELTSTGPPVGAFAAEEVRYTENTAALSPGGTLLLYSDGVTEARRGKTYVGIERLRGWLARFLTLPPDRLVRKLLGSARAFVGGKKFRDDVALLALRRRKHTN
ncbi:MAG: SpoIIE family protein phosphatase [Armatimonadota bacterium]